MRITFEQSLLQGVNRASYTHEADVSPPTASNDFRRLLDAGLVVQMGKGRVTRYVASANLRSDLRRHLGEAPPGPGGTY
jgi:DNA-binding transcriptional ArsR family regulator